MAEEGSDKSCNFDKAKIDFAEKRRRCHVAVQVPVVDQAAQMAAAMEAAKAKAAQISAQAKAKDPADEENPMAPAIQAKQAQADLIRQAQLKAAQIAAQTSSQAQATNDVASMVAQAQAKAAQISAQAQAQAQLQAAQLQQAGLGSLATGQPGSALSAAQRVAALISARAGFQGEVGVQYDENGNAIQTSTAVELEINDYPQQARWKVTHKDAMNSIVDNYQVSVTTKGAYFAPGRNPPAGERKLYLTIEGTDENNVARAKRELRRMLEEAAAGVRDVGTAGRYNV